MKTIWNHMSRRIQKNAINVQIQINARYKYWCKEIWNHIRKLHSNQCSNANKYKINTKHVKIHINARYKKTDAENYEITSEKCIQINVQMQINTK